LASALWSKVPVGNNASYVEIESHKIPQFIYAKKFPFSQPFKINGNNPKFPAHLKLPKNYQILQKSALTILSPCLQENASANIGKFDNGPLTRYRAFECESVKTCWRSNSDVDLADQTCA